MQCPKCQSGNIYQQAGDNHCQAKCRNCGREKNIVGDGLCSGCYFAAKPFEKGTADHDEALAEAKKRFTDPGYKRLPRGRAAKKKGLVGSVQPIEKIIKTKLAKPETKSVVADVSVVDQLIAERNRLQDKVFKINQAIELLS